MGYNIYQRETQFLIREENLSSCLEVLMGIMPNQNSPWKRLQKMESALVEVDPNLSLSIAMEHWAWSPFFDKEGNIIHVTFVGEKLTDDMEMFDAIAPFVERGSHIQMAGEDFAIWRWYFDGENCIEEEPEVVFPRQANC